MWREWVRERVADPNETEIRRRIMWMLAVNVSLGLALVWFNLMVQDLGYRVANTGNLISKLEHEHAELIAEHAREASPETLRRSAETLGLGVPRPGQVMALK
jgi:hypothetical protein